MKELSLEQQLIFEIIRYKDYDAARIEKLLNQEIDFPWVLGQLLWHRVGGVAYYVLHKSKLLGIVNREFRNSLKSCYDMNVMITNDYIETLKVVGKIFESAPFQHAFLKGAYLSVMLYPRGLRTANDIDILIHPSDVTKCSNLLLNNGFKQGYYRHGKGIVEASRRQIVNSRINRGETVPFLKGMQLNNINVIEVDINFSLDYKAKQSNDNIARMLSKTQRFNVNHTLISTFADIEFLIQLCVHLYKEAVVYDWVEMNRDLSLYKFCDIYTVLKGVRNKEFLHDFTNKTKRYGLEHECYYALHYTKKLYPCLENIDSFKEALAEIKPINTAYLNEVIKPATHKTFKFNMNYKDWLFHANRKNQLMEVEF